MTTNGSPTPRRSSDARLYKAIADTEHRLMDSFEKGLKDVKDLINERKNETVDVRKEFEAHEALEGHPLLLARVIALEKVVDKMLDRQHQVAIKSWQVVTGLLFIIFSFVGVILTIINTVHSFVK